MRQVVPGNVVADEDGGVVFDLEDVDGPVVLARADLGLAECGGLSDDVGAGREERGAGGAGIRRNGLCMWGARIADGGNMIP